MVTPDTDLWKVDPGPACPEVVRMIVEIGKNSSNKYEYDPELGVFRLDRVLHSPIHFPGDYGFIPGTIAEDGEPIDVLSIVEQPTFPSCMLEIRPIGILDLIEESETDHKVLAVPRRSPRFDSVHTIADIGPHVLDEIQHFFTIYKELEGKRPQMHGWRSREDALNAIRASRAKFLRGS